MAVAMFGALAVAGWLARWPPGVFGGASRNASAASASSGPIGASAPADAATAVADLASRSPATLRAALVTGYPVNARDLAPPGTMIRMRPGTWRQQGDYATVQAVVALPEGTPASEIVYFVREEGRWRVLFADPS
jgi:hypothetical protein